ncbi:MAG: iron-containing alcohol dehydrogenase, partial [Paracoccaceae bacterium]
MLNDKIGRIQSPKIIKIGGGVAKEIGDTLRQLGLSRPLIVTDQNLLDLGHVDRILNVLDKNKISYGLFSDVVEDPTDACIDAGLHVFKSAEYDCIIGLGGGSPMDTAKAISFM